MASSAASAPACAATSCGDGATPLGPEAVVGPCAIPAGGWRSSAGPAWPWSWGCCVRSCSCWGWFSALALHDHRRGFHDGWRRGRGGAGCGSRSAASRRLRRCSAAVCWSSRCGVAGSSAVRRCARCGGRGRGGGRGDRRSRAFARRGHGRIGRERSAREGTAQTDDGQPAPGERGQHRPPCPAARARHRLAAPELVIVRSHIRGRRS